MELRTYALGVLLDFLKLVRFDITLRDGAAAFRIDQVILGNVVVGIQRSAADPGLGVRVLPFKDYPSAVPNGPALPRGVGAFYNDRHNIIFIEEDDASYRGDLAFYIRSRVVHEAVHAGFDIWRYAIPVATEEVAAHLVQTLYLRAKGFAINDLPQGTKIVPVLEECGRLLSAKSLTPAGSCSGDFSAAELANLRQMIIRLQGMQVPDGTRSADRIGVASFDFGGRTRALEFQRCR